MPPCRTAALAAALAAALLSSPARAQDGESGGRQSFGALVARADDLEPARRLGMRSALHLSLHAVIPDVVIVPDEAAYLAAIRRWEPSRIFPVLIDDGSDRAREDIARFVRAFEARRVLRWSPDAEAVPPPGQQRRRAIEIALARAWDLDDERPTQPALLQRWLDNGVRPPGIVGADDDDPAWPAALALAAARAQPIAWIPTEGRAGGTLTEPAASALSARVRAECQATGLAWDALGDDIDAVTLCMAVASKAEAGDEVIATTDLVGRDPEEPGRRWAWCAQIFGDAPRAAYTAMCSLFLKPDTAWLFDGYTDEGAFAKWDATKAAEVLRQRGLAVRLFDEPNASVRVWRHEAARPLDAGLVLVNTQGMRDFFELNPGRAHPGDVPLLARPALVHFVHSWSAQNVTRRDSVGARWIERGAFGYVGAVREPYLQAFVPTPVIAARLVHGYPWGAAGRIDDGPPWKIAVFGDALHVGTELRRLDDDLPIDTARPVEEAMRTAVDERRLADAAEALVTLGRDADAARLALAVLGEQPERMTPRLAAAAIPAAFRAGRRDGVIRLFRTLPARYASDPLLRDVLWLAARPQLAGTPGEDLVNLLRTNLRDNQLDADAPAVAQAVARLYGGDAALGVLREARDRASTRRERRALERAIDSLGGG